jgi:hypothetical protein
MWEREIQFFPTLANTVCFADLGKLNLFDGGSILSSSQFLLLPQQPLKMKFASKVVIIDSKLTTR